MGGDAVTLVATADDVSFYVPSATPLGPVQLAVTGMWGVGTATVNIQCEPPTVLPTGMSWLLGGSMEVVGTGLAGSSVSIAGIAQVINATSPSSAFIEVASNTPLGAQVLTITNPCGTSTLDIVVAKGMPVITGTNPSPVVRGQPLNIQGDFLSGATVSLGGVQQNVTLSSQQGVTVAVASSTPVGVQDLVVTTAGGTASVVVDVLAPPFVGSIAPNPVNAGESLTIIGQHLEGASVTIGEVVQVVSQTAPGSITLNVHPDTPAGGQVVLVTTGGGSVTANVVVIAPPSISDVAPAPVSTGQLITVSGKNLTDGVVSIGESHRPYWVMRLSCDRRRIHPLGTGAGGKHSWRAGDGGLSIVEGQGSQHMNRIHCWLVSRLCCQVSHWGKGRFRSLLAGCHRQFPPRARMKLPEISSLGLPLDRRP